MPGRKRGFSLPAGILSACAACAAAQNAGADMGFRKVVVSSQYEGEGSSSGDFNLDGKADLACGPYWYEGPEFTTRHAYQTVKNPDPRTAFTDQFFTWVYDVNGDARPDILTVGVPGSPGYWFQNPGPGSVSQPQLMWTRHTVSPLIGNESPALVQLVGDSKPELVFNTDDGYLGWAAPDPAAEWKFHAITPKGSYYRFTHGLGIGDVNGDGRLDVMEKEGWWEQPASLTGDPVWIRHAFDFSLPEGGAQMFAQDLDGDGDHDVVTTLHAHGWGLAWYEQVPGVGGIQFIKHVLMGTRQQEGQYGVAFSDAHALAIGDMDGDGLADLVTGKRKWGHGPTGDFEPNGPFVLFVFKLTRIGGVAAFQPILIDSTSGIGTQLEVKDINSDGRLDILTANKNGTFVFLNEKANPARVFRLVMETRPGGSGSVFNALGAIVPRPIVRGRRAFHRKMLFPGP